MDLESTGQISMKTSAPEACYLGHRHRTQSNPPEAESTRPGTLSDGQQCWHQGPDYDLRQLGGLATPESVEEVAVTRESLPLAAEFLAQVVQDFPDAVVVRLGRELKDGRHPTL